MKKGKTAGILATTFLGMSLAVGCATSPEMPAPVNEAQPSLNVLTKQEKAEVTKAFEMVACMAEKMEASLKPLMQQQNSPEARAAIGKEMKRLQNVIAPACEKTVGYSAERMRSFRGHLIDKYGSPEKVEELIQNSNIPEPKLGVN